MLTSTLASKVGFLPIQIQKGSANKLPMYLVFSNKPELTNYIAITTSGQWPKVNDEYTIDHDDVFQLFRDEMFVTAETCPQYHDMVVKELIDTTKAKYNPLTALKAGGFITETQFSSIAEEYVSGLSVAADVPLEPGFDMISFTRRSFAAKANGSQTPLLPGIKPDVEQAEKLHITTVEVNAVQSATDNGSDEGHDTF